MPRKNLRYEIVVGVVIVVGIVIVAIVVIVVAKEESISMIVYTLCHLMVVALCWIGKY
jgi:hypothetical protein